MLTPKVNKKYLFVRLLDQSVEHTEFVRYEDGSAGFVAEGMFHVHEGHEYAWEDALLELAAMGFIEETAAKAQGVVAADWMPTSMPQTTDQHDRS